MKYYIFLLLTLFVASCQQQDKIGADQSSNWCAPSSELVLTKLKSVLTNFTGGKSDAEKALISWANAYFNFNYEKAMQHTTPESEKWIRLAASNITEQDVSFIREQNPPTQIEILNHQQTENDTVCNTYIRVSKFIQLGLLPQDNRVIDQAIFHIQLVNRSNEWLVRMEGLPQSGKQSRD